MPPRIKALIAALIAQGLYWLFNLLGTAISYDRGYGHVLSIAGLPAAMIVTVIVSTIVYLISKYEG